MRRTRVLRDGKGKNALGRRDDGQRLGDTDDDAGRGQPVLSRIVVNHVHGRAGVHQVVVLTTEEERSGPFLVFPSDPKQRLTFSGPFGPAC